MEGTRIMSETESRPRILFVDDEPNVTANLKAMLRKQPWEISTANSGADGLAAIAAQPFDVVVSDERMPEMSGSEFLTRVRELQPQAVRLILSGQASLDATIRAINEAGIFRFLTKPCEKEDLIDCLNAAIEAGRLARSRDRADTLSEQTERAIEALDDGLEQLWVAFQPIGDWRRRAVFGFEALARCDHPAIPHPGVLFAAAEAADRVPDVERAIRALIVDSLADLEPGVSLFVNLHPSTLADPEFFDSSNALFGASERIVLEVTERCPLEEIDGVEARIDALRASGFRIAIDDLGAGYAGLNTFAKVQPDVVKLDLELIRDVDRSRTNAKVIESMVRLARELDCIVVAEGIETAPEYETLTALGCDLIQGFLLARPAKGFTHVSWPDRTDA